jgi:pimeloyl-ACP methyl ester carboxylesterase
MMQISLGGAEWVRTDDGARLRVQRFGLPDRPTIVLSHGWACRLEYWQPQIDYLARRFHIVAYDQRGHGESTRGRRPTDTDVLADDLAQVFESVISTSAVAVGHSMGGIAVQAWWQRHPEQAAAKTSAAVLANTTWGGLVRGIRAVPLMNGRIPAPEYLGRKVFGLPIKLPDSRLTREVVRWRVMNPRHTTKDQAAFVTRIVTTCNPHVRAHTALALADVALGPDAAGAIGVPTSVIVGRVDKITPAWMGRDIASEVERHGHLERLVELDTGHTSNIEAPDVVNTEIERMADLYG